MTAVVWKPEWFLGGDVVLDLLNTVPWRLEPERRIDRLPDLDAVISWSVAAGLLTDGYGEQLRAEVAAVSAEADAVKVREFRETLYRLLQPIAVGKDPQEREIAWVRSALVDALTHAEIASVVPLRWTLSMRGLQDLPRLLALSAWRLLQFEDLARLRQCHDAGCGWLFLDRSKNGSRVWCSAADCGNRTRVRRHRTTASSAPASPESGGTGDA